MVGLLAMVMVVIDVMVMVVMKVMVMVWMASLVWMVNLADSAEVKEVDDLVVILVPKDDKLARALLAVA